MAARRLTPTNGTPIPPIPTVPPPAIPGLTPVSPTTTIPTTPTTTPSSSGPRQTTSNKVKTRLGTVSMEQLPGDPATRVKTELRAIKDLVLNAPVGLANFLVGGAIDIGKAGIDVGAKAIGVDYEPGDYVTSRELGESFKRTGQLIGSSLQRGSQQAALTTLTPRSAARVASQEQTALPDHYMQALAANQSILPFIIEDFGNISMAGSLYSGVAKGAIRGVTLGEAATMSERAAASQLFEGAAAGSAEAAEAAARMAAADAKLARIANMKSILTDQMKLGKSVERTANKIGALPFKPYSFGTRKLLGLYRDGIYLGPDGRYARWGKKASEGYAEQAQRLVDDGVPMDDPRVVTLMNKSVKAGRRATSREVMKQVREAARDAENEQGAAQRAIFNQIQEPLHKDVINPETGEAYGILSMDEVAAILAIQGGNAQIINRLATRYNFPPKLLALLGRYDFMEEYSLSEKAAELAYDYLNYSPDRPSRMTIEQYERLANASEQVANSVFRSMIERAAQGYGRRNPLPMEQMVPTPFVEKLERNIIESIRQAEKAIKKELAKKSSSSSEVARLRRILADRQMLLESWGAVKESGVLDLPVDHPDRIAVLKGFVDQLPIELALDPTMYSATMRVPLEFYRRIRRAMAAKILDDGGPEIVGPDGEPTGPRLSPARAAREGAVEAELSKRERNKKAIERKIERVAEEIDKKEAQHAKLVERIVRYDLVDAYIGGKTVEQIATENGLAVYLVKKVIDSSPAARTYRRMVALRNQMAELEASLNPDDIARIPELQAEAAALRAEADAAVAEYERILALAEEERQQIESEADALNEELYDLEDEMGDYEGEYEDAGGVVDDMWDVEGEAPTDAIGTKTVEEIVLPLFDKVYDKMPETFERPEDKYVNYTYYTVSEKTTATSGTKKTPIKITLNIGLQYLHDKKTRVKTKPSKEKSSPVLVVFADFDSPVLAETNEGGKLNVFLGKNVSNLQIVLDELNQAREFLQSGPAFYDKLENFEHIEFSWNAEAMKIGDGETMLAAVDAIENEIRSLAGLPKIGQSVSPRRGTLQPTKKRDVSEKTGLTHPMDVMEEMFGPQLEKIKELRQKNEDQRNTRKKKKEYVDVPEPEIDLNLQPVNNEYTVKGTLILSGQDRMNSNDYFEIEVLGTPRTDNIGVRADIYTNYQYNKFDEALESIDNAIGELTKIIDGELDYESFDAMASDVGGDWGGSTINVFDTTDPDFNILYDIGGLLRRGEAIDLTSVKQIISALEELKQQIVNVGTPGKTTKTPKLKPAVAPRVAEAQALMDEISQMRNRLNELDDIYEQMDFDEYEAKYADEVDTLEARIEEAETKLDQEYSDLDIVKSSQTGKPVPGKPASLPVAADGRNAMADYVIIPCGKEKSTKAAKVEDFYLGSMFQDALNTARQLFTDDRIFVVSAKHGLVPLDTVLEPYDMKMGDPGSVTPDDISRQITSLGLSNSATALSLLPSNYHSVFARGADRMQRRWTVTQEFAGTKGIGQQKAKLKNLRANAPKLTPVEKPKATKPSEVKPDPVIVNPTVREAVYTKEVVDAMAADAAAKMDAAEGAAAKLAAFQEFVDASKKYDAEVARLAIELEPSRRARLKKIELEEKIAKLREVQAELPGQLAEAEASIERITSNEFFEPYMSMRGGDPLDVALSGGFPTDIGNFELPGPDGEGVRLVGPMYYPSGVPGENFGGLETEVTREGFTGFKKLSSEHYRDGDRQVIFSLRQVAIRMGREIKEMVWNERFRALVASIGVTASEILGEEYTQNLYDQSVQWADNMPQDALYVRFREMMAESLGEGMPISGIAAPGPGVKGQRAAREFAINFRFGQLIGQAMRARGYEAIDPWADITNLIPSNKIKARKAADTLAEEAALDDGVTPTPDKIVPETMFLPKGVKEQMAQITATKDVGRFEKMLKGAQKVTSFFKVGTLVFSIPWQIGDLVSNMIISTMTGVDPRVLIDYMKRIKVEEYGTGREGFMRMVNPNADYSGFRRGPYARLASESGVQNLGQTIQERAFLYGKTQKEIDAALDGVTDPAEIDRILASSTEVRPKRGVVDRLSGGRLKFVSDAAATVTGVSFKINETINKIVRHAFFLEQLDMKLREKGQTLESIRNVENWQNDAELRQAVFDAARSANQWLGDYANLTIQERKYLTPIFPFWAWIRHVHSVFDLLAVENPESLFYYMYLGTLANEDDDPLGLRRGGFNVFGGVASSNWVNPFADVVSGPIGAAIIDQDLRPAGSALGPVPRLLGGVVGLDVSRIDRLRRPVGTGGYSESGEQTSRSVLPLIGGSVGETIGFTAQQFPIAQRLMNLNPTPFDTIPGTRVALGPVARYQTGEARLSPDTGQRIVQPGGRLASALRLFGGPLVPYRTDQQINDVLMAARQKLLTLDEIQRLRELQGAP